MRNARLILNILAFCVAASGSIWIGWIYAGSQLKASKSAAVVAKPSPDAHRPATNNTVEQFRDFGPPPDLSGLNFLPGASGAIKDASEVDGFPTISKDAIERAAGYSDNTLPEVEIPFKIEAGGSNIGGESAP